MSDRTPRRPDRADARQPERAEGGVRPAQSEHAPEPEQRNQESRTMEAVSRLVSGIAHELNNLLTVVAGNTELLLHDIARDDPRHELTREIRGAAQRAATLTRNLLAFGRQETLSLRVVDLAEGFRALRPRIEDALGDRVTLELELDSGPAPVRVDPALARQVLFELVSNARDAMPEGGRLRIEVRSIHVAPDSPVAARGVAPGEWVAVGYSDTGTGMTESVRERAMDPFFSTKDGRSGLGLSTVHGLVKQSEGEVWIESARGQGTTVWTYLPRVEDPEG